MTAREIAQQAKLFQFELNSAKYEYSFSSTDSWIFHQSTASEKLALEQKFYPVLFVKCEYEDLASLAGIFIPAEEGAGKEQNKSQLLANSKDRIYLVAHCDTKLKY
ncbi:hypothetical protein [Pedobacter frigoris]|uniref:Uncharacterized protein n=1 Tax=Pedobacter frigoris TaxID=2571272 RepID=A0A4U1CHZ4_9SPHI|nr:hypothetical protein [Pedobacter frigoris]TKC06237.1 hypothetical protein FA047_13025 [Pedobacter frigoris]